MGRRKRAVHPWMDPKLALKECRLQLGEALLTEATETLRLAFGPVQASEEGDLLYRLTAEERQTCAADALYVLERNHNALVTGGTAALLECAIGAVGVRDSDQFEAMRKAWDETLRRAREREFWSGPHLAGLSPREMFGTVAYLKATQVPRTRRRASPDQMRVLVRFELAQIERGLARLDARALRSLHRKLRALRLKAGVRKGGRLLN